MYQIQFVSKDIYNPQPRQFEVFCVHLNKTITVTAVDSSWIAQTDFPLYTALQDLRFAFEHTVVVRSYEIVVLLSICNGFCVFGTMIVDSSGCRETLVRDIRSICQIYQKNTNQWKPLVDTLQQVDTFPQQQPLPVYEHPVDSIRPF